MTGRTFDLLCCTIAIKENRPLGTGSNSHLWSKHQVPVCMWSKRSRVRGTLSHCSVALLALHRPFISTRQSRNRTIPACVMRTPLNALIASYMGSKLTPSMSFHVTNTLTLADAPESVSHWLYPTTRMCLAIYGCCFNLPLTPSVEQPCTHYGARAA